MAYAVSVNSSDYHGGSEPLSVKDQSCKGKIVIDILDRQSIRLRNVRRGAIGRGRVRESVPRLPVEDRSAGWRPGADQERDPSRGQAERPRDGEVRAV